MKGENVSNELAVVKYDVTDAALSELKAKYTGLKIADTDSYDVVRRAIGEVRDIRVSVEERRKELKASALEYGRRVDSEAKRITTLLLQIEEPLKAEKAKVDDEKARIKAEKEKKELDRVAEIRARIFAMQQLVSNFLGKTSPDLQQISEALFDIDITKEVYQEFTDEAERVKMECLDAALKAREMRITWEQEEAARKVEAERLEKQRQDQEAERKRLDDEKAKLEAEKKAEQARKDREEIERLAKEKAEKEAREKVEREAKEKQERDEAEAKEKERKAAMAPDKEKLLTYAHLLEVSIQAPPLESEKAMVILSDALKAIKGIVAMIRKEAGKL
jgi:septal ring factor EnvC (AmiA/AmiB activator)